MKGTTIYGSMVNSFDDLRSTLSREFSIDKPSKGKGTSFGTVLLVGVGLMLLLVLLFGSTSVEPFTYMLEDGREGERLTGKIKNIRRSTGYYGGKVPKTSEGFSVKDDRRITVDDLSGTLINKRSQSCCCINGNCLRPEDCPPSQMLIPCNQCAITCG